MRIAADWVTAPHSSVVMQALDGQGFFVGGCVRNALLGVGVSDIDIATPLPPQDVLDRLNEREIKAIPTGLKHGTITAVHQGVPVEVTTFRCDVETDGRHAIVAFTDDIAQDAARRDFTMNALYADRDGELIDPLNGLPDLQARKVRFIGEPRDRIREDYLRILRFFRFHAWYGDDGIDPEGLAACSELADGIDGLARERIGWEFRKLFSAADPALAASSMQASGILLRCLEGAEVSALPLLVHLEQEVSAEPDWLRRLAVLGGAGVTSALRLSKTEARQLDMILDAISVGEPDHVTAYRHGRDIAQSVALVRAASTGSPLAETLDAALKAGEKARLPIKAKDILASGVPAGPEVGVVLKTLETRWIASGFELDKTELLSTLSE